MSDEPRGGDAVDAGGSGSASEQTTGTGSFTYDRHTTVIAQTVVRVVVPIILVTAIGLLLQGHNRPGGGFIGGVLTATAFVLVYVIFGMDFLQTELLDIGGDSTQTHAAVEYYRWLFAAGLALAAGSGLIPLVVDLSFLTQAVLFVHHVPLYGEFELASAFVFDLGVYLTVVGGLLTVLGEVGNE